MVGQRAGKDVRGVRRLSWLGGSRGPVLFQAGHLQARNSAVLCVTDQVASVMGNSERTLWSTRAASSGVHVAFLDLRGRR